MKKIKQMISMLVVVVFLFSTLAFVQSSAAGTEHLGWKQYDSRWGSLHLGNSAATMSSAGCLVTSMAIAMYDMGYTENGGFNPGVFVNKCNSVGGFTGDGNYYWSTMSRIISGASTTRYTGNSLDTIRNNLSGNNRVVINVNGGGHWVYVQSVSGDGNTLTVSDVGSSTKTTYGRSEVLYFCVVYYANAYQATPEPPHPGSPVLAVEKATNKTTEEVRFTWAATTQTTNYDLRVLLNGTVVQTIYSIVGTSYTMKLQPGSYTAFLCSVNANIYDWWTKGNTISFSVVGADYIPKKTIFYKNHYYSVYDENLTWKDAKSICESMGGTLAVITNAQENANVLTLLQAGTRNNYFIGHTDEITEGTWATLTAEKNTYSNWRAGEPNNAGNEDYQMIYKLDGKWNDGPNDLGVDVGFICEVSAKISPKATVRANGKRYELYDNNYTWKTAKLFCESKGMHLATITSLSEQACIYSLLSKGSKNLYFLGTNDVAKEGTWRHLTGEKFSYTNWNTSQPDNWQGVEDYLMIYKSNGKWNDLPNQFTDIGFIAENDHPGTLPAPAKITGQDTSYDSVSIGWSEVKGAAGYQVYRGASANTKALIDVLDNTQRAFTDDNLKTGKSYYYAVSAFEKAGTSKIVGKTSKVKCIKPIPARPTVSVEKLNSKALRILWSKVDGANGYRIYMSQTKTGGYRLVKNAKSSETSFQKTGLKTGVRYFFKLKAFHLESTTKVFGSFSTIASGLPSSLIAIASVVGNSEAAALSRLNQFHVTFSYVFSTTEAVGIVVSQNPKAGTKLQPGTTVNVYVSKGPEKVAVPNVIGMNNATAAATLRNAGLTVNDAATAWIYRWDVALGIVVGQSVVASSQVLRGTLVQMTASSGAKPFGVGDTVWYGGGAYYSQSHAGGAGPYYLPAQTFVIAYAHPDGDYQYCLQTLSGGLIGWTAAGSIAQRTN